MEVKILFMVTGNIENIKISTNLWNSLHYHRENKHFYRKDIHNFFKKYNLKPTYFNLNCMGELMGVILTDSQILKINKLKGGKI